MNGRAAIEAIDREKPDLVVLDLGLPDIDGVEVCRKLRESSNVPIVVLSARGSEGDKVARSTSARTTMSPSRLAPKSCWRAFARACAARTRLRRPSEPIARGDLVIDREKFRVLRSGEEIRLTPKEFELLTYLAQHPGRVLTHRMILKAIWGPHAVDQPEHLRVLIAALRKKIEPNPSTPKYILTEPWVGYRFADE